MSKLQNHFIKKLYLCQNLRKSIIKFVKSKKLQKKPKKSDRRLRAEGISFGGKRRSGLYGFGFAI